MVIHTYRAFGLTIASQLACPQLLPRPGVPLEEGQFARGPAPLGLEVRAGV